MEETGRRVEILCYIAQNIVSPMFDVASKSYNHWVGNEFPKCCTYQANHTDDELVTYLRQLIQNLPKELIPIWEKKLDNFQNWLKQI